MKKILLLYALIISAMTYSQGVFTSSADGNWTSNGTWTLNSGADSDGVPDSDDSVTINHTVTVNSTTSCVNLTINSSKRLNVNSDFTSTGTVLNNGKLRITSGDMTYSGTSFTNNDDLRISEGKDLVLSNGSATLTNTGDIQISSSNSLFGSLILSGTYTSSGGSIEYKRYIASSSTWDLIGSPLTGVSIEDFEEDNSDIAENGTSPTTYAIGTYTNTSEAYPTNQGWTNYTSSNISSAGSFVSGLGYQMATTGGSAVEFTGGMSTANVTLTVTTNEEGTLNANDGTKFSLIANPYPSYISVTSFLDAHKTTQLHSNNVAVYGWDGNQYDTYSLADPGTNIAPGQGFMIGVKGSNGTSQTITFTTAMQTATGSGDYSEQNPVDDRAELFINLNQNNTNKQTKLFFLEQGTDGLDPGYDAATMDLGNYSIYSRLISGDEGVNMDHQSLAFSEINDKVIPLGINADSGNEATISISNNTTNPSVYVYLEDALEGTYTNLKETDFVITPDSDLEGIGRFFIHTTASTMSDEEDSTTLLKVYKLDRNNFISIEGLATQSNITKIGLYDILGNKILFTTIANNINTRTISTEGLATGIYIIKLQSGNNFLTKKLIIK